MRRYRCIDKRGVSVTRTNRNGRPFHLLRCARASQPFFLPSPPQRFYPFAKCTRSVRARVYLCVSLWFQVCACVRVFCVSDIFQLFTLLYYYLRKKKKTNYTFNSVPPASGSCCGAILVYLDLARCASSHRTIYRISAYRLSGFCARSRRSAAFYSFVF